VVAATGKASEADFLKGIGASEVMGRGEVDDDSGRPILSGRWAGGVDTVGGNMLATLLKTTNYGGAVTCCGLVASPELDTTVFPFILRGIKLIGIDSVLCPMDLRLNIWEKIATDWKVDVLDDVVQDCGLADLDAQIDRILAGQMRGRVVVDLG
jgi:putative YhdH/YhfP family quinone oxidoreductase